jgi:hypothetical protein
MRSYATLEKVSGEGAHTDKGKGKEQEEDEDEERNMRPGRGLSTGIWRRRVEEVRRKRQLERLMGRESWSWRSLVAIATKVGSSFLSQILLGDGNVSHVLGNER